MRPWFCGIAVMLLLPLCVWAGGRGLLVADMSSQAVQNARADADHLSRMRDLAMIRRFAQNGYLVAVPSSTDTYYLHAIPPPYRYCRPWTKLFLDRVSHEFYVRFRDRLRVSSLVRTVGRQRMLTRVNDNAADATGELQSSHLTGATLDISKHSMTAQERSWMRDLLYSLRESGYLYAIEEFQEPTFHVMVFANYPQYVKRLNRQAPRSVVASSGEPPSAGNTD
jgi:Family of unknown function (DUF5715)